MDIWAATSYKPQNSQILHISLKNDTFFENSSGKMFLSMQFKAYIRRSVFFNSLFKEGGKDMKRIVVIICITIALLAAAVGTGYRYGLKEGCRYGAEQGYKLGWEDGLRIAVKNQRNPLLGLPRKSFDRLRRESKKMQTQDDIDEAVNLCLKALLGEPFKFSPKPEPGPGPFQ